MTPQQNLRNKRGTALISALFIMTLVAIVVISLIFRLQTDVYRRNLIIQNDKLYLASQALIFWGMSNLEENADLPLAKENYSILQLPKKLRSLYPNFELQANIYDLQGRFNLNNLVSKFYVPVFLNLLDNVLPNLGSKERDAIVYATFMWINPYTTGHGQDELQNYYLKQNPPYYPGYQLFQNLSEFRLVRGVTAEIYRALEPYITVLPETTPINLNSVAKPLLMSLSPSITEAEADEIIKIRKEEDGVEEKMSTLIKKYNLPAEQITLNSNYFQVVGKVTNSEFSLINKSVLKRSKKDKKFSVGLIEEEIN